MNSEREPKCDRSGIKKSVVNRDLSIAGDFRGIQGHADTISVCDDASPPPKHQKEDNKDEQCVESINLGDGGIKPKRARECHKQARAQRRGKHQKAADA